MIDLRSLMKRFIVILIAVLCIAGDLQPFPMTAYAKEASVAVDGKTYEFDKDSHYEFSATSASGGSTFGTFTVSGELKSTGNKNGAPAYSVSSENVSFYYSYNQSRLNATETEWHLIDDKTKKLDTISLDKNILSGTIVVQSSKNGVNWITDATMTNVFTANSNLSDALYTTKGIQLENGCYYRIIVAYELQIKTGEKKTGPFTSDITEEKKIAEVYEFYAVSSEVAGNTSSAAATPRKELVVHPARN